MGVDAEHPGDTTLEREIVGLDALEFPFDERKSWSRRLWNAMWPTLLAVVGFFAVWQCVVWVGWRPRHMVPSPDRVLLHLLDLGTSARFWSATMTTTARAFTGFGLAMTIGTALGVLVSGSRVVRRSLGSLIAGLQSMPSITWFPAAILVFDRSEAAILFVVVLGASPAIANGLINAVDHIPPILLRAGHVLGARGVARFWHIVLPAALPGYLAGLKQGWAFAWRSLLAGELLVIIEARPALGSQLQVARELSDAPGLFALMIVILLIGVLVDGLLFATLERRVRRQRGLMEVDR